MFLDIYCTNFFLQPARKRKREETDDDDVDDNDDVDDDDEEVGEATQADKETLHPSTTRVSRKTGPNPNKSKKGKITRLDAMIASSADGIFHETAGYKQRKKERLLEDLTPEEMATIVEVHEISEQDLSNMDFHDLQINVLKGQSMHWKFKI